MSDELFPLETPPEPLPAEEVKETAHRQTAHDVEAMLRAHLGGAPSKPEPGFFVRELEAPDSTRRADVLWVPLDSQTRGQLWGYEVKVSRSDVLTELRDVTKADAWLKFCDRWWLVVSDRKHVEGLDIPAHWGILAPPEGRNKRLMTVIRRAPALQPVSRDAAFAKILARLYYGDSTTEAELKDLRYQVKWRDDRAKQRDAEIERLEQRVRELGGRANDITHGQIERLVSRIVEVGRERGVSEYTLDAETVIDVIVDAVAVRRVSAEVAREADFMLSQLERIAKKDVKAARNKLRAVLAKDVARETEGS